jgi:hypothetical protein
VSSRTIAKRVRADVRIVTDRIRAIWPAATRLPPIAQPTAAVLDSALDRIAARYGARTTDFVSMQLEYARRGSAER